MGFSWNGTAGRPQRARRLATSFFPLRFRVSLRRKPPISSAFFMSSSLVWTLSDRFKWTSAVACLLSSNDTCALNLIRSTFGYRALKSFQAFLFALSAISFASSDLSHASPKARNLRSSTFFIAFIMKMVVLTIIADSNDHKVRFREPLGKLNFIRLFSCSLSNSWYNLKRRGEISVFDTKKNASVKINPLGEYTLDSLSKATVKMLKISTKCLEVQALRAQALKGRVAER